MADAVEPRDNPQTAYEPSDWHLGYVALVFGGLLLFLVGAPLALLLGFSGIMPDANRQLLVEPPPPRLQVDPKGDLAGLRSDEDRRLNTYYWIDRDKGVVHIPIDEAMRKVVAQGIDGFPQGRQ